MSKIINAKAAPYIRMTMSVYEKKRMWRTLFCSVSIYFQVEAPIPKTKAEHPIAQKHVFGLDEQ